MMTQTEIDLLKLEEVRKHVNTGWRLLADLDWVIKTLEKKLLKERENELRI